MVRNGSFATRRRRCTEGNSAVSGATQQIVGSFAGRVFFNLFVVFEVVANRRARSTPRLDLDVVEKGLTQ